jgi:hypothetical protein
MVLEAKASGECCGVVSRVARQLGIEPDTLRHSAAKTEVDEGLRPGVPAKEKARLAELERDDAFLSAELRSVIEDVGGNLRQGDVARVFWACRRTECSKSKMHFASAVAVQPRNVPCLPVRATSRRGRIYGYQGGRGETRGIFYRG